MWWIALILILLIFAGLYKKYNLHKKQQHVDSYHNIESIANRYKELAIEIKKQIESPLDAAAIRDIHHNKASCITYPNFEAWVDIIDLKKSAYYRGQLNKNCSFPVSVIINNFFIPDYISYEMYHNNEKLSYLFENTPYKELNANVKGSIKYYKATPSILDLLTIDMVASPIYKSNSWFCFAYPDVVYWLCTNSETIQKDAEKLTSLGVDFKSKTGTLIWCRYLINEYKRKHSQSLECFLSDVIF